MPNIQKAVCQAVEYKVGIFLIFLEFYQSSKSADESAPIQCIIYSQTNKPSILRPLDQASVWLLPTQTKPLGQLYNKEVK